MTAVPAYVQVLLPLRLQWIPTYSAPTPLEPGRRVCVALSGRSYDGVVWRSLERPDLPPDRIQPVLSVRDDLPAVTPEELRFWEFLSAYYLCTLGEVYKAAFPLLKVRSERTAADILARKYFYPLVPDLECYAGTPFAAAARVPVARSLAARVLCLPLYAGLQADEVDRICDIVLTAAGHGEVFSAGLERAEGIFHVITPGGVVDGEGAGRVVLEEGLDDLLGLGLGRIARLRDDGDLEGVVEPGGEVVGVALRDVFADGDEYVEPARLRRFARGGLEVHRRLGLGRTAEAAGGLGRQPPAGKQGKQNDRYFQDSSHGVKLCKIRATLLSL